MATAKARKLSEAQLRILRNLEAGQPWDAHISGRSALGNSASSCRVRVAVPRHRTKRRPSCWASSKRISEVSKGMPG